MSTPSPVLPPMASQGGVIARLVCVLPPRFVGSFYPGEARPSTLGRRLWSWYHDHFKANLPLMLQTIVHEGVFPDGEPEREADTEPNGEGDPALVPFLSDENAALSGCFWSYGLVPSQGGRFDAMLILAAFEPLDTIVSGTSAIVWCPVAVVALRGAPPDWEALDSTPPLDPHFEPGRFRRLAL